MANGEICDEAAQAAVGLFVPAHRRADDRAADRRRADAGEHQLSAVYRNLSDLEADGLLKRSVREGTRDVFYQYIAAEECKDSLHLSCRVCGKSIHLGDAEAERLLDSTLKSTGFQIDKTETILYGVCADCRKHRK